MKSIYLTSFAIALFFSGCVSAQPEPKAIKIEPKIMIAKPKAQVKEEVISKRPKWIDNPDMDNNTGAVGIVELMDNKKKQRYIAKKLAIASLQERKRVMIKSSISHQESISSDKHSSETRNRIKQTSSHYNAYDIIFKDEYSSDTSYYVWMVIKK